MVAQTLAATQSFRRLIGDGQSMPGKLPTVLQSESGECGLACLAAITRAHNGGSDLAQLRQMFPSSTRGTSLGQLIEVAQAQGMNARALRVEISELSQLKLPAILHWDLCHYVVLISIKAGKYLLMDPATGRASLEKGSLARHFTGIALELCPTPDLVASSPRLTLDLLGLLRNTRGLAGAMTHTLLIASCLQLLTLLSPIATQWILDRALPSGDQALLQVIVIASALLGILTLAFQAARGWLLTRVSAQVRIAWSGALARHLFRLPLTFFQRRSLGGTLSRFDSMRPVQELLTETSPEVVLDGALASTTLLIMSLYAPGLALICAATWMLYAGIRWLMFPSQLEYSTQVLVQGARERSCLLETLRNVATWKQRAAAGHRSATYLNHHSRETHAHPRMRLFGIRAGLIRQALGTTERVLVLWLGATAVITGELSVGMLVAFLAYKIQFSTRVANLVDRAFELRSLGLHRERIAEISAHPVEEIDREPAECGEAPYQLALRNASYRHNPTERWLFRDVNVELHSGQWVALHAASGIGKTTLISILGGLLEPSEGQLLCNGREVKNWLESYRRSIGAVLQQDGLLSGTLAENICFFDSHPDRQRIEQVAKIADIHEDIVTWPLGYFTRIGELDHALSGGQMQRLLIARALYHRPRLLLLDEAFSQLDVPSENRICEGLKATGITCLAITHRQSSLEFADRVLTLQGQYPAALRTYRPR